MLDDRDREALMATVGAAEDQPKPEPKRKHITNLSTDLDKQDPEKIGKFIVGLAGASKDRAMVLVDEHVQRVFDAHKLSKVQAAAQGLDEAAKKKHNADLWNAVQTLRGQVKKVVRDGFKVTIAAKVRKHTVDKEISEDAEFTEFLNSPALKAAFEAYKAGEAAAS